MDTGNSPVEIVGPFEEYRVVVNGYRVPYLSARPVTGGKVRLTLDSRISADIKVADMQWLVEFIADCIAVAAGYTCHPGPGSGAPTPIPRSIYRRSVSLDP